MSRTTVLVVVVLLTAIEGGAATVAARGPKKVSVTYHSDPEGASLYEGARLWGYTPLTLRYDASEGFRAGRECDVLSGPEVRWVSGATASIANVRVCPVNGGQQQFTFVRPDAVPGRELDVQFLMQREYFARLDAAAAAQATRDAWARLAAAFAPRPQTTCTSTVLGWQIVTRCQ